MKKLSLAKVANRQAGRWVPALINHLYKVVSETAPQSQLRTEWWKSAANHICDVHQHESELFPLCMHGELESERVGDDGEIYIRDFIDPGKSVYWSLSVLENSVILFPFSFQVVSMLQFIPDEF